METIGEVWFKPNPETCQAQNIHTGIEEVLKLEHLS